MCQNKVTKSCSRQSRRDALPKLRSPLSPTTSKMSISKICSANGLLTPQSSRSSSPSFPSNERYTSHKNRKTNSSNSTFTSLVSPCISRKYGGNNTDISRVRVPPSTVTWESADAAISNQKIETFYEKPTYSSDTQFDSDGNPIPGTGHIVSYGRMLTKTITVTVTTTLTSTEILHPHEHGYEASLAKYEEQERDRAIKSASTSASNSPVSIDGENERRMIVDDEYEAKSDRSADSLPSIVRLTDKASQLNKHTSQHDTFHSQHHNVYSYPPCCENNLPQ